MRSRKILALFLALVVAGSGIGVSAAAFDSSSPYSNFVDWVIASDTTFTVDIAGGQTKVVFSPASKTEINVEPAGQSDGVPIFTVTNSGNVDLNFSCNLTEAKPTWATIKANDEYANATADDFNITLQLFNASVGVGNYTRLYLWTNVTDAVAGTANRTMQIWSEAA